MWERIRVILRKEFIQALRDPRMRVLLFVPPIVQLLIFGFAVNLDVDHARIAWMDMDRTPASRELRSRFEGSGRFEVVSQLQNETQVHETLDRAHAPHRIDVRQDTPVRHRGVSRRGAGDYGSAAGIPYSIPRQPGAVV